MVLELVAIKERGNYPENWEGDGSRWAERLRYWAGSTHLEGRSGCIRLWKGKNSLTCRISDCGAIEFQKLAMRSKSTNLRAFQTQITRVGRYDALSNGLKFSEGVSAAVLK